MKTRLILVFFLFAGAILSANAQDLIILKNGDELPVKVIEIGIDNVKYKKINSESAPVYSLLKSEIRMIKYENGEKERFEETSKTDNSLSALREEMRRTQSLYQTNKPTGKRQQATDDRQPDKRRQENYLQQAEEDEPIVRKAYIGVSAGYAVLSKKYSNIDGGMQVNINFGYLFSDNIGIALMGFLTDFKLSNQEDTSIGLTGLMVGPLFTKASESGKFEFDLRPMIGYAGGSVTIGEQSGTTDETALALGVGGSIRWNCSSRVSLSVNADYCNGKINKVDLSSTGITLGVNYRF
jgi:hypothetical protein